MIEEAQRQHIVQDLPRPFIQMTLVALADTVMELVRQDPKRAEIYRTAGFEMLWGGIQRKR